MSKRIKFWLIIMAVLVLLVASIYIMLWRWMGTTSSGTVHVGSTTNQADTPAVPVALKTPYFTTLLPAGFNEKRRTETPQANQTLLQLFATGGPNRQLDVAITVGIIPLEGLEGVNDYNLRRTQTATYTPYVLPNLPSRASAFRTLTGSAGFVVFWPVGTRYYELSFSSDTGTLTDLQQIYTQVIGSWQAI